MSFPHLGQPMSSPATRRGLGPKGSDLAGVRQDTLFGAAILVASAALSSADTSLTIATAYIARWRYETANGWTLTTSGTRTVVAFPATDTNTGMRLSLTTSAHGVGVIIPSDERGDAGYFARVEEAAGPTRMLRLSRIVETQIVDEGAGVLLVPNGASDIPASVAAEVDITADLASGNAYTLDVRRVNGVIEVRLNDEADPRLKHNTTTAVYTPVETGTFRPGYAGTFNDNKSIAFASTTNGARVLSAKTLSLTGVRSSRADVLLFVSGGNVYACTDGSTALQIGASAFPPDATIDMDEFNGNMIMIGGGQARIVNATTLNVANFTPTDGTLPGQTVAGTTTANIVTTVRARLAMADIDGDEQNCVLCATNNHLDWNTGKDMPGAAYAFSGYKAARIGQPITAVEESPNGSILVGTTDNTYLVVGEPALGQIEALPLSNDSGISGKDACWKHPTGPIIAHSPQGLVLIGGNVTNLSAPVLTTGIQFETVPEDLVPIVIRDPRFHGTHIILTRTGSARAYWYDERTGGMRPGAGGLHPEEFPAAMAPTCATLWGGRPVFGCDDGYIRDFTFETDTDDGEPVPSRTSMPQLMTSAGNTETTIHRMEMVLSTASAPVVLTVLKASTAQKIYDGLGDTALTDSLTPPRPAPMLQTVRGPCLLVQLAGENDQPWALEYFEAHTESGLQRSIGG